MANKAIAGVVYVRIDGTTVSVRGNVKCSMASESRESIAGVDGVHGHKVIPAVPFIELDVSDGDEADWTVLAAAKGVEIQAELTSGKVAVLSEAVQVNQLEVDGVEGQATLRFEGRHGEWQ